MPALFPFVSRTVSFLAVLALSQNAVGDLILNLSGTDGSSVINYEATGSVTVTQSYSPAGSAAARAPVGGVWRTDFDENLGTILLTSQNSLDLSGDISYRKNGTEFATYDRIDLHDSHLMGLHDIELKKNTNGSVTHPALVSGDVVSWTGSGTFTLASSETFDTTFITGSFSNAIDGGNYTVNVTNAVPEPSSLALLGIASVGLFARRRCKRAA